MSEASLDALRPVLGQKVWAVHCPGLDLNLEQPGLLSAQAHALRFGGDYAVVTAPVWFQSELASINAHRFVIEHTDCPPWMEKLKGSVTDWMEEQAALDNGLMPVHDSTLRFTGYGGPGPAPVREIEVRKVRRSWSDGVESESVEFDRVLLFKREDGSRFSLSVDDDGIAGSVILAYEPDAVDDELADSEVRITLR